MSTLAIQGTVTDLPDGSVFRSFDQRVPCSPDPSERVIELTSDATFSLNLDGLTGVHALHLEADHPVSLVITSSLGASQVVPVEFLELVSTTVAITAIGLTRVAGQATTVRLILGQKA